MTGGVGWFLSCWACSTLYSWYIHIHYLPLSHERQSQGGKGHLNHSLEVSLCKSGALYRDLL